MEPLTDTPIVAGPAACRSLPPAETGGKAENLALLADIGQPVPPWFVVTARAFRAALDPAGFAAAVRERGPAAAAGFRARVLSLPVPPQVEAAVRAAVRNLAAPGSFLAVRSSAAGEDSAGRSFAGMHDSFLFVRGEDGVLDALRRVWASAFNDRAVAYRLERGIPLDGIAVAVVVQVMVEPAASGVMFTADPVTGDTGGIVISALYGAGEGLVSAGLDADTFTVDKAGGGINARIADKAEQVVFDAARGSGVARAAVAPDLRLSQSLADAQVRQLAAAGLAVERACGRPQDIEFAFDRQGSLFLLQTRPITTAPEYGPAAGNPLVWDNSNIIESYSGVTSPMTFSFIRRAYAIVYHCFAEVMGIAPDVVRANRGVFENMLGLFRGQVYYNLLNWYRLVRLFPGFNYNREFMESMMGVKEPLEPAAETRAVSRRERYLVELPRLARLVVRSAGNFLRIRRLADGFEADFDRHFARWAAMDFDRLQPHELMNVYRDMEDSLLWNWRAPIINDFYVMIHYGLLRKLCAAWAGDAEGSLQNDLLCGEGGIRSTEPTRMLLDLASAAQKDAALRDLILSRPPEETAAAVAADPRLEGFRAGVRSYLGRFGFRCMNELKLEEYSLEDRPHFLFAVLRNYLALDRPEALDVRAMQRREGDIRRAAEARAFRSVRAGRMGTLKLPLFRRVLRNARLGVRNRENMRFARTRIYGLLRRLLRALGRRLAAEEILRDPEDIFMLTLDECRDFIAGAAVTTNLAALAALRRAEFDAFRNETDRMPADRFTTHGMACHRNLFRAASARAAPPADGVLRGVGCCPGRVTGPVKVLRNPGDDMRLSGEILVAERTDPGWVPLYPSVSGLLIERGSILSHSAIVAREMGLPAIVGIPGLTAALKTGQRVEMDGAAGTVRLIGEATA